ncbi:MAG: PD-(D/E)XK nuclease family protein [Nanoarchaeota archaeon]|nr:PD-(D/E)XK nuclease family protein [Nanoarchaeota archaeon]
MTVYSHSKVSCFENCPYQYKLKYIDKIKVDVPTTIECFMGDIVHQTLEKLYKDKKFMNEISKEKLLEFYDTLWNREYSDDILIVKKDLVSENYKKMGAKFVGDYYDKYEPFEEMTILGLETTDRMTLPEGNQWHVRIDKLGCDDKGNYYVVDYKTNARMKDQEEADEDRQLAMYSFWVKDKFRDCKKVILKWNMLAFNKEVVSERTDEQLAKLQEDVCARIKEIESATEFPRKQTGLCPYCVYKSICPSFKHELELEEKSIEEFKKDDGLKLVDEFSEVKMQLGELKKKSEELKTKLVVYGKQFGIDAVYGSNKIARLKEFEKIVMPEDRGRLIALLKEKGIWDDFCMLSYAKLNGGIVRGEVDDWVRNMVDVVKDVRISLGKRKDVGNGE